MTTPNSERLLNFKVTGMTCGHCQRAVESAIRELDGVSEVVVNLQAGQARVVGSASEQQIIAAVEEAGYEASQASDS
jgi:copper chaperone